MIFEKNVIFLLLSALIAIMFPWLLLVTLLVFIWELFSSFFNFFLLLYKLYFLFSEFFQSLALYIQSFTFQRGLVSILAVFKLNINKNSLMKQKKNEKQIYIIIVLKVLVCDIPPYRYFKYCLVQFFYMHANKNN